MSLCLFNNDTSQATSNIEGDAMWGEFFSLLKTNLANLHICNQTSNSSKKFVPHNDGVATSCNSHISFALYVTFNKPMVMH